MSDYITTLEQKIKEASQAYYLGEPIISDLDFDSLVLELRKLNPESEFLKTGWGYKPDDHLEKFSHTFHCGSLDKLNIQKLLDGEQSWKEVSKNDLIILTSKLDGNSAVAYYDNGNLVRVLSRGDGEVGCDITKNILPSGTVPLKIADKNIEAIRGEIIVTEDDFKIIGGSHPRNVATGLSQSKYSSEEDLKRLKFIPYFIKDYNGTYQECLSTLFLLGFLRVPHFKLEYKTLLNELRNSQEELKSYFTNGFQYPIDGIVFSNEDNSKQIALKFEDESAYTRVLDIDWQMSRTGRLVPVLNVETTNLRGANISRVTANNATWISEMSCGPGSKIEIIRANEVIPKVIDVLEPAEIALPEICPICSTKLEIKNRDLVCPNDSCNSKLKQIIFNIFNQPNLDGIGPANIDLAISDFGLVSLKETYYFLRNVLDFELVNVFKDSKSEIFRKLINHILNKSISLRDVLIVANIPNVGFSCAEKIDKFCENYKDLDNVPDDCFPTYLAKENYFKFLDRIKELVKFYSSTIVYNKKSTDTESTKKKYSICLTGVLSKPRTELVAYFNQFAEVKETSITSCDFLITDSTDLTTTKAKEALKRNKTIISEKDFLNLIKN